MNKQRFIVRVERPCRCANRRRARIPNGRLVGSSPGQPEVSKTFRSRVRSVLMTRGGRQSLAACRLGHFGCSVSVLDSHTNLSTLGRVCVCGYVCVCVCVCVVVCVCRPTRHRYSGSPERSTFRVIVQCDRSSVLSVTLPAPAWPGMCGESVR